MISNVHINARIQNLGGVRYHNGEGVPQSFAQAKEWWEKAARLGHADAMTRLGSLFGQGVPQSFAQAKEWWETDLGL